MNQRKLAEARRLYHHVCNGGTLTPEDVSFMVVALEEAYEEPHSGLPKRSHEEFLQDLYAWAKKPYEWVGLTREEEAVIIEQWHMDEGKPAQLCRMIQEKLKEKNT